MRHERLPSSITTDELARLGTDQVAYMKRMTSDEVIAAFPEAIDLSPGLKLWVLFAADGSPLVVADDQGSVFSTAFHNDLRPVSLH